MARMRPSIACALVIAAGSLPGRAAEDPAAEVGRLEQQLVAAIARGDLAAYDRLVADDYVVINAAGPEDTKAQVMARYRSGERGYRDLQISDVRAHVFGDTAVVSARTSGFRHEGEREVPNNVRYIRVYARRSGTWRAVAQMSAPLPSP